MPKDLLALYSIVGSFKNRKFPSLHFQTVNTDFNKVLYYQFRTQFYATFHAATM